MTLLRRVVDVRTGELPALMWAWAYIFTVLSAYYVMRPIRDQMGVAGGVKNLQWLFLGTLIVMIVLNVPFGALVKSLPRTRFIPMVYRFFAVSILGFAAALHFADPSASVWLGRAFFIWISVFVLFVVSVFWQLIVDTFSSEDGKRLFGFIAAGATLGAITGSGLTASLAKHVPISALLIISAVLLEVSVVCVKRLSKIAPSLDKRPDTRNAEAPVGGSVLAGFTHAFRSSYLGSIVIFMLLFAITSTFIYFQQADIVSRSFTGRGEQTAFFARIDLAVNVATLIVQLFLTAKIVRWVGVGPALAFLPLITIVGFGTLGAFPTALALMVVQVTRRASDYAITRPTREVLYTVVPREDRYKTKSFIDTVIYRTGDQIGAWSYAGLLALGLSLGHIATTGAVIAVAWLLVALYLGRRQRALENRGQTTFSAP